MNELSKLRATEDEHSMTSEEMHQVLFNAITEHSLPPGTKLREEELAEAFGVSRTRIRELLFRLNHLGVVDMPPRRIAMVAKPTKKNAREVFHARKIIETGIVSEAATRATKADIKRLQATLEKERIATETDDRSGAIRHSGDFHLQLCELIGNDTLTEILKGLVSRTSLVLAVFGPADGSSCDCDNHMHLLNAIAAHDKDAAVKALWQDLTEAEEALVFLDEPAVKPNLKALLSPHRAR
ncbi:putative GntR-type transcriptional regulator (plasmid) [Sinorhizobium fredii HH103]|uniref:GntR-type transcriptional regulator n=1 Tax=Sinorhizobium fredii (strain HH103) TaxID=1117943 RepID=G9AJ86_SINF1|nr:GntR family transcriptional regulator [Sinorhizobium fredii]CCF01118.1 putative GntR-type transcriptional regulator [Sinorhizobium fredii HH103]